MEKVIKYRCSECGKLFDVPEYALRHEVRHEKIQKANEMLRDGCTLQQIEDKYDIWGIVPEYLQNVTKENCFKISWIQCCDKPAYQIVRIDFDGEIYLSGCGSWDGYYGSSLSLRSDDLKDPRPKEELFVDGRYQNPIERFR